MPSKGKHLVILALCLLMLAACERSLAQIRTVSLPLPPNVSARLLELADGRLAVVSTEISFTPGVRPSPEHVVRRHYIRQVEPSGKLHPALEIPMRAYAEALVPFRQGFVRWERNRERAEVHHFDVGEILRASTLYTASDVDYLYLSASPRGDTLYVTESLRGGGSRVTRIDANGRPAWSKVFAHVSPGSVLALSNGIAFAGASPQPTDFITGVLTRLSDDGEQQWQVPVLIGGGGVPAVVRHSGDVIGVASQNMQGELELSSYAADSGRRLGRSILPSDSRLTGTRDGVLVDKDFLHQPYLTMVASDGSMRWWRRFRANETVGDPGSMLLTQSGDLVMLTGYQTDRVSGPVDSKIVFVDREARALSDAFGECTRLDPLPLLRTGWLLEREYFTSVSTDYELAYARGSVGSGCPSPTEHEYAAALRAIETEFADNHVVRVHADQRVFVRLMGGGPELELISYNMGLPPSHSPPLTILLHARVDTAPALAALLRERIFPHIDRIRRMRENFHETTGQTFVLLKESGNPADLPTFLEQAERAARTVDEKIQKMAPGQFKGTRHVASLMVRIDPSGNTLVNDQPLENADQALLQAIEDGTRRREERRRELEQWRSAQ